MPKTSDTPITNHQSFRADYFRADAKVVAATRTRRLERERGELMEALQWAMHHVENVFALAGPHDREKPDLLKARTLLARLKETK